MQNENGFNKNPLAQTGPGELFELTPQELEIKALLNVTAKPTPETANTDDFFALSETWNAFVRAQILGNGAGQAVTKKELLGNFANALNELLERKKAEDAAGPPKISHLEAFVSIVFDECSISSEAARSHALREIASKKGTTQDFFFIGPEAEPNKPITLQQVLELEGLAVPNLPFFASSRVRLILDGGNKNNQGASKPQILAVINNNIALPLVSFEKRDTGSNQGKCVYAQIAQEITNENIVFGPADKRKNVIEAIRRKLDPEDQTSKTTYELNVVLHELIQSELERYSQCFYECLEASAVRALHTAFNSSETTTETLDVTFVTNGLPERMQAQVAVLAKQPFTQVTPDGRAVELLLVQPVKEVITKTKTSILRRIISVTTTEPEGPLYVMARVRGNVTIPLLAAHENGKFVPFAAQQKQPTLEPGQDPAIALQKEQLEHMNTAFVCQTIAHIAEQNVAVQTALMKVNEINNKLKGFFGDFSHLKKDLVQEGKNAEESRSRVRDLLEIVLRRSEAEAIIASYLGTYNFTQETFMNRVIELGNRPEQTGTATKNNILIHGRPEDLLVQYIVKRTPQGYYTKISVRPALSDGEYETYFEAVINPFMPLDITHELASEVNDLLSLPPTAAGL